MIRWIALLTVAYLVIKALRKSNVVRRNHKETRNRPTQKSPHTILEITPNASAEEVKQAYRKALSKNHPDKVAHLSKAIQETARTKMDEIQWAYDQLK